MHIFPTGGTDIQDQKMGRYSTKPVYSKWTTVGRSYMLDTARVNATTLFCLATGLSLKKSDSFLIGMDLVSYLCLPQMQARSRAVLSAALCAKMDEFLGLTVKPPLKQAIPPFESRCDMRRKCYGCIKAGHGVGYNKNKDGAKKVQTQCQSCKVPCCDGHSVLQCESCFYS